MSYKAGFCCSLLHYFSYRNNDSFFLDFCSSLSSILISIFFFILSLSAKSLELSIPNNFELVEVSMLSFDNSDELDLFILISNGFFDYELDYHQTKMIDESVFDFY